MLVNPGRSQTIIYENAAGGLSTLDWNPKAATDDSGVVGFPTPKRDYYSFEESLERPWDGKWMAKVDYVWAKGWGNTEGPTESATGQISNASGAAGGHQAGSITEAWVLLKRVLREPTAYNT